MTKRPRQSQSSIDLDKELWLLGLAGYEVQAIGHLIKNQERNSVMDQDTQLEIGEILERLGKRIAIKASRIEQSHLEKDGRGEL